MDDQKTKQKKKKEENGIMKNLIPKDQRNVYAC